ncbi:MAG: DNA polymerase III subunit delta, partial [Gallionellaceae bacterium]
ERQIFDSGAGFDWQQLAFSAASGSLFAQKKIIDLRIQNGKPGKEGAAALLHYLEQGCHDDTLLLIRLPFLNRQATNSKWFKSIEREAGVVQIWPVTAAQAPTWIQRRARANGLQLDQESVAVIAEATEGNLLAADQLIQKMCLDFGPRKISLQETLTLLSDDSKFDVGNLIKYVLQGDCRHVLRVWQHLKAMNEPQTLILWMLADTLRNLITLSKRGLDEGLRRKLRKDLLVGYQSTVQRHDINVLHQFLQRSTVIDQTIKGVAAGDSWQALLRLSLDLASRSAILDDVA